MRPNLDKETEERFIKLEDAVGELRFAILSITTRIKRAKGTTKSLLKGDIPVPVNDCQLCDGSGHILTSEGPKLCACHDSWVEKLRVYSEATKLKVAPRPQKKNPFRL
jgi:hypothetical protein